MMELGACQRTPCLLFSRQAIRDQYARVRESFPGTPVFFAVKANPHQEVARVLHEAGCGFEVSSVAELEMVTALGVSPERLISSNPIKAPEFVRLARRAGIVDFVVDSVDEVRKMVRHAPDARLRIRLAVDNSRSLWPLSSKFGAAPGDVVEILREAKGLGVAVDGVTFHVGSQCVGVESWIHALEVCRETFGIAHELGTDLRLVNLGGGLPVRYVDPVPGVEQIGAEVRRYVGAHFGSDVRLEIEPGRALVAEAAVLVVSVIGKAVREGKRWLYLDGGIYNCLLEALEGFRYDVRTDVDGPLHPHTLAGPSCDSTDVLMSDVLLPDLEVGDRVYVLGAGAYSLSYASHFGGFDSPEAHFA